MNSINQVRRKIILSIASLPLLSFYKLAWSTPGRDIQFAKSLTTIINDKKSAKIIGKIYIDSLENEPSLLKLLNQFNSEYPELENLAKHNLQKLKKRVICIHKEDFNNNRTICIEGWIVSCTEARLFALLNYI